MLSFTEPRRALSTCREREGPSALTPATGSLQAGGGQHTSKRILFFTRRHIVLPGKEERFGVSSTQELIGKGCRVPTSPAVPPRAGYRPPGCWGRWHRGRKPRWNGQPADPSRTWSERTLPASSWRGREGNDSVRQPGTASSRATDPAFLGNSALSYPHCPGQKGGGKITPQRGGCVTLEAHQVSCLALESEPSSHLFHVIWTTSFSMSSARPFSRGSAIMVILFLVRKETGNEEGQQDWQEGRPQEEGDRGRSEGSDIRESRGGRAEQKGLVFFHLNPSLLKKSKAWEKCSILKL